MIVSPGRAIARDTRLKQRLLSGNDGHLAGELVYFSDGENLILLAGPANRYTAFHPNEEGHIGLRGFIENFTSLYRPELGDGPNAVYLFRTQIGRLPIVRASKGHQATPLHLYVNFLGAQNRNPSANINM